MEQMEQSDLAQPQERVLVCITIQENSKRLIEKGADIARRNDGELHILHVEQGKSIFEHAEAVELLEALFEYAKSRGGQVHFESGEDVPKTIMESIQKLEVTQLVLGQTGKGFLHTMLGKSIARSIASESQGLEVVVLEKAGKSRQETKRLVEGVAK
ncbi:universal stress protein [Anaerotalea alkaliphila]|uniref:Universal stress protein n=1 Tax=Anaerotalea alkaliphila TaxID=2662126 RepID=A0A7X5HU66_9FIRM|nr:universal stress protein [Anaerotalea alkaliphila]NDL66720.1 universal stress protein [Anaerotalea alkaliphila]